MALSLLVALAGTLLVPSMAMADDAPVASHESAAHGDEAGHGEDANLFEGSLVDSMWALIVFVLLLVILGKFAWKPIVQQLEKREKQVADTIDDATRQRDEAMELLAQYKQKLDQAHVEAQKLMAKASEDGEKLKEEIVGEARSEAELARERAVQQIEASKNDALAEIFTRAADLATGAAGQILQRELRPEDHQRLIEQTLSQLGGKQANN